MRVAFRSTVEGILPQTSDAQGSSLTVEISQTTCVLNNLMCRRRNVNVARRRIVFGQFLWQVSVGPTGQLFPQPGASPLENGCAE
jgi:hypothetical protein